MHGKEQGTSGQMRQEEPEQREDRIETEIGRSEQPSETEILWQVGNEGVRPSEAGTLERSKK